MGGLKKGQCGLDIKKGGKWGGVRRSSKNKFANKIPNLSTLRVPERYRVEVKLGSLVEDRVEVKSAACGEFGGNVAFLSKGEENFDFSLFPHCKCGQVQKKA